jgi:hypothetical protein
LGFFFCSSNTKNLGRYFAVACVSAEPLQRGVLRQYKFHKEQAGRFPDWPGRGLIFGESNMANKRRPTSKSMYHYCPHQDAAKPSDRLKILGQELREHYELPHDLPHGMFTRLIELNDRGGSAALQTRAEKYRALATRA